MYMYHLFIMINKYYFTVREKWIRVSSQFTMNLKHYLVNHQINQCKLFFSLISITNKYKNLKQIKTTILSCYSPIER